VPGVLRTRVGFSGGRKLNPTYHSLGDHTETIQIQYDATKVTYAQLLDIFWSKHNPCRGGYSRQYISAIFFYDSTNRPSTNWSKNDKCNGSDSQEENGHLALEEEDQLPIIKLSLAKKQASLPAGTKIMTVIEKATPFYQAEGYHQKFMLRSNHAIMKFLGFTDNEDFLVNSTIAARLNGVLGKNATVQEFEATLKLYKSVSEENKAVLMKLVKQARRW